MTFSIFLRRDGYEAFTPPDERFTKVLADFRPYSLAAQVGFPRVIRRAGVDLMHFTHFDHPLAYRAPFLVTIHDVILLHHPSIRTSTLGPLRFWTKYAAYRRVLHHAVHGSWRILTPSRAVKEQIAETFSVLREKIVPTLLGVDHGCPSSRAREFANAPRDLNQRTGFLRSLTDSVGRNDATKKNPYLLYVGNCYPHKNVEQLIRVMPTVREQHPDLRLFVVGREDDFARRLNTKSDRAGIVFIGAVADAERSALFSAAAAYVSASADEGFDLPAVEALAAGIPVIASDIAIHREILGASAWYFPVGDDRALHDVIHRTITSADRTAPAMMERKRYAERFTWRACAAQTLAAYRETATLLANRKGHKER